MYYTVDVSPAPGEIPGLCKGCWILRDCNKYMINVKRHQAFVTRALSKLIARASPHARAALVGNA